MKKGILLICLFCVFLSCKREEDRNKFGPETIIVEENFTVEGFTVSPSYSINLATQEPYFNCTMSKRAEFKIKLQGLLSGAEKNISGAGESINVANSVWTGDSDNLNMFRAGEKCLVELSFRGALKKYYDTITVTAENIYPNATVINNIEGITFDKTISQTTFGTYFNSEAAKAVSDIRSDDTLKTCQGAQSVSFDGKDVTGSYYIGGLYFHPSPETVPFVLIGNKADFMYCNAYVYSYGDNNTKLSFAFSEDDNGDGVLDKINDDSWTYELTLTGKGWTLVSIPFKSFIHDKAYIGNGRLNPDKILSFNINLNSIVPGGHAKANLDYLVISNGRPFEP